MAQPAARRVANPVVRQRVLSLFVLVILAVFAARLVVIQGVRAGELSQEALAERLVTKEVATPRADIVDRNGVVLATSVDRYNVGVNQKKLAKWVRTENGAVTAQGPVDAAKILAPILGLNESELAATLVGDATWKYIAKDITPETWALVDAENIAGIEPESTTQRIYPNGTIAGNVIGFTGGNAVTSCLSEAVGSSGLHVEKRLKY